MTPEALRLRRAIFEAFAATGEPPRVEDSAALRELVEGHVLVLDAAGRITMAHPFAAPGPEHPAAGLTRVEAPSGPAPGSAPAPWSGPPPGVWWGSCAWDGLGIAAALGLDAATITSGGVTVDEAEWFHVAVPARHWWDDIGHT